jgi:hypothetical protein
VLTCAEKGADVSAPVFLIFTLTCTDHEVLLVDSKEGTAGIIYQPKCARDPIPWLSTCPHCISGRFEGLPLSLKQMVKLLTSRSPAGDLVKYVVPANGSPYVLAADERKSDTSIIVSKGLCDPPLGISCERGKKPVITGDQRLYQSPILHRCLRFLCTRRLASKSELRSLLLPLVSHQKKNGIPKGNRFLCRKIDWRLTVSGK